jgi:hypothetical protein
MDNRRKRISRSVVAAVLCSAAIAALSRASLYGAALDELKVLSQLPTDIVAQCQASPDQNGLVGKNRTDVFVADDQRGAMDGLVAGLVLKHDKYIELCWRAVTATYDRQATEGDFTGKRGSSHMRFWMAWSNHALFLLAKSPRYGPLYQDAIQALLPKVQRAMDYLTQYGPSQLSNDYKSPNRTMIIATAYELGARLLEGYSDPERIKRYLAEAHRWIDNEFVNQKLFRVADGVFKENGGYDTSYQGVATRFYYYCLLQDTECTPDALRKGEKAGAFLSKRFLPEGVVDCTYNTRSGQGNVEGSPKKTDLRSCRFAMLYYAALYDRPEALNFLRELGTEKNELPPVLIGPLSVKATVGVPLSVQLSFTNAGFTSLDPDFKVAADDLPPGLAVDPHFDFNQSTGFVTLKGTPSAPGSFQVRATAENRFGANTPIFITVVVE